MARAYAGTVMLEGATLSEGRGTTRPLEVLFGAPDVSACGAGRNARAHFGEAPEWLRAARCANAGSPHLHKQARCATR
jgi:hypothetical protein